MLAVMDARKKFSLSIKRSRGVINIEDTGLVVASAPENTLKQQHKHQ